MAPRDELTQLLEGERNLHGGGVDEGEEENIGPHLRIYMHRRIFIVAFYELA